MKVVILGAGHVGSTIAACLAAEENDITVIDQSVDVLKKVSESIDIQPIYGFASHPDVLAQAGVKEADLLVAVTGSDEVNLVACEVANSLYGVKTKIARLRHQSYLDPHWRDHLFSPEKLAIDVTISPEVEVARTIARSVQVPGASEVISLLANRLKVIGIRCQRAAAALNTPLRLLPTSFPKLTFVVLFISRNGNDFIPSDDDMVCQGDEVYFAVSPEQLSLALEAFGIADLDGRNLLIMGGGNIGLTLAKCVERPDSGIRTRLIEFNPKRAEELADQLENTEVLCGDALDLELLTEANAQDSEMTVAVTQDDKVNILASLLAKQAGAKRVMTLLNNMSYAPLVTSLGVDAVISPQSVTVSTILQHIRQERIRSVHSLHNGAAEIVEGEARETSHVIGLSIADLNIPHAARVIALVRDDVIILDPLKHLIRGGDRLMFVVAKTAIKKLESLFAIRPSYL